MSAYLPHRNRLRTSLALVDLAGLAAATWTAYMMRFDIGALRTKWPALTDSPGLIVWAVVSGLLLAGAAELYEPEILYRRREMSVRVAVTLGFWVLGLALAGFLVPAWTIGRGVLALTVLLWGLQMILVRFVLTRRLRGRTRFVALVVGDPEPSAEFCEQLKARPSAPWRPIDVSHLAVEDIPAAIEQHQASLVILRGSEERARTMGHDLAGLHFSGVPVVASTEIWAWLEERLPIEALSPAIFLHQPGFGAVHYTLFNRITRITDMALSLAMLVASAPLFLVAAAAVAITDGFPVLFRQERLGQYGRPFIMYKLRTMYRDAESAGPQFAEEKDPRTIPVGRLFRRLRIDELPQLINVLRGEMSLVGPRPERPEFVAELTEEIPYYAFRMAVPPGITGWAQVNISYAREVGDHRRKLEYDLYFIRERSTRLYLLTLLRTASAALVGVRR